VSQEKWIAMSERKPKQWERCIIAGIYSDILTPKRGRHFVYTDVWLGEHWNDYYNPKLATITHWQSLPPHPDEVEEKTK
jgi:hypothetical protein